MASTDEPADQINVSQSMIIMTTYKQNMLYAHDAATKAALIAAGAPMVQQ